ncbi:transcriptional regulator, TetR family [Streptomyces sp. yr375]|uniref:TetR/AcrR family transcriptional regulator n=1 Tax=Streptomyces sp. yr375 TaxID=1761906 RepID=UPI0008C7F4CD|nr:TetR/AcrR family transcriptional regulator [Streptomyces sp. yr375]SES49527.1 transcriptional regulator, TetR family [Streptomyces sp. yr375]
MSPDATRRLRADAARNSERILRAAREVYAESGPDAMLEEIARRAGVGIATLYRRFPNKEALVRAALEQSITEQLSPAIEQALDGADARQGLVTLLEAALVMVARERNTLAAADNPGALTTGAAAPFLDSLMLLVQRGQRAGTIRADLVPDDMQRIIGMLMSVLWNMDPDSDGWRRYVALMLDALSPVGASPLPPAAPMTECREGRPGHPTLGG